MRLVNVAAKLLRANLQHAERITVPGVRGGLAVYGRSGQRCRRCARARIEARRDGRATPGSCTGARAARSASIPRRRGAATTTPPMDRHPAAAKFLDDLPWRRRLTRAS